MDALYLTKFAHKVYLVHRRDQLRGAIALQRTVFAEPKIEFVPSVIPKSIIGKEKVAGLKIENVKTGENRILNLQGLFVAVGNDSEHYAFKGPGRTGSRRVHHNGSGYAYLAARRFRGRRRAQYGIASGCDGRGRRRCGSDKRY